MNLQFSKRAFPLAMLVCSVSFFPVGSTGAQEISRSAPTASIGQDQVDAIGGYWYVSKSEPKIYYYRDAGQWLDLFSYHCQDSNKDGIPNMEISHDQEHLIIKSQGYPNHPTAIFPNSDNPNEIRVQDFTFRFPLVPRKSDTITRLPRGPIGMSLNGMTRCGLIRVVVILSRRACITITSILRA